jgi:hypothetical protein
MPSWHGLSIDLCCAPWKALAYAIGIFPSLLLLRCRYAGCSYETAAAAAAGDGSLLVKGVKAVWRQSAPLLQHTLMVRTATP